MSIVTQALLDDPIAGTFHKKRPGDPLLLLWRSPPQTPLRPLARLRRPDRPVPCLCHQARLLPHLRWDEGRGSIHPKCLRKVTHLG